MNSEDFIEEGLSLEESVQVGSMLQTAGIDAIELSGGTPLSGKLGTIRKRIKSEADEAYYIEVCAYHGQEGGSFTLTATTR